jgi:hypothetical protein
MIKTQTKAAINSIRGGFLYGTNLKEGSKEIFDSNQKTT